ncbi:MAG TPA: hypothetical protein PKY77_04670 [Phycisphaerae bacterium]|nr:hypothetical protein [Phycisphaerae bacterium]HRY67153.1 hypothetical protein [Phycisphaerae bacterium]HSA26478.1 hypothetical protein [Phycisphaerae bacterium]
MKRRTFLKGLAGVLAARGPMTASPGADLSSRPTAPPAFPPARAATRGPKHHFFGYYDKTPWDHTGRYLLAMEVDFIGRDPRPGEAVTVGMVDLKQENRFLPLDTTTAWSWQQGTMLQWLGSAPDREIIYNTLDKNRYVSVVRDVHHGRTRRLPRPVYDVSLDGKQALTLDFERVNRLRPGYGYVALPERLKHDPAPHDAGIYWMDLATGNHRQLLSIAWAARNQPLPEFENAHHWFNHLKFNPSGTRFLFLHRWRRLDKGSFRTRLYTADRDGGNVRLLSRSPLVSHFDWRDDETILVWTATEDNNPHFFLVNDRTGTCEIVGQNTLTADGHCSYSPDRKWILLDTYPDRQRRQRLFLYRPADAARIDLGDFAANPKLTGASRCDLHPRWNRDGTRICFDGSFEPTRQMYIVDVPEPLRSTS